jgi:hypothetical protein
MIRADSGIKIAAQFRGELAQPAQAEQIRTRE